MPRRSTVPNGTVARGYGEAHRAERRRWAVLVNAGGVCCSRCGRPIPPGSAWHLDHDDHDRTRYRGPSCVPCNTSAGARLKHARLGHRARRRPPDVIAEHPCDRHGTCRNRLPCW